MYYLVTIGYETEQTDRNGDPRIQKVKYVFEADSVEETTIIAAKYLSGDSRSSQLLAINMLPVECIVSPKTTPEYYNKK